MIDMSSCPIAVVGLACRLPGSATDGDKLWDVLSKGKNVWSEVPTSRFNEKSFYHPHPEHDGTTNHQGGHFLDEDISLFDAAFFGISPAEAQSIDPQQRLLLEIAYEALENAGHSLETVRGSDTAVYTAMFTRDYALHLAKDPLNMPKYGTTGAGDAIIANRVSYIFDLKGPSISMDTGCSGSLVAINQACQALRAGETSMALASGVSIILQPDHMFGMSNLHMLNENGRSYPFDERGDGYGRGEGVATVVLKRLTDAIAAGDRIRAVIRGSGVNQDGKTSGLTMPNRHSQERLIRDVYSRAGIDPQTVQYVEAHGTGTRAGDEMELSALAATFGDNGRRSDEFFVGSIKSNIGHLESASGIAGFIKVILMLERGYILPNADFKTPKSNIDLERSKIRVPTKLTPWSRSAIRRASVNSFGYGGTNAHIILEEADPTLSMTNGIAPKSTQIQLNGLPRDAPNSHGVANGHRKVTENGNESLWSEKCRHRLFPISAQTKEGVFSIIRNLKTWAEAQDMQLDDETLDHLSYTLTKRRSTLRWRYSLVADSAQSLISSLRSSDNIKPIQGSVKTNIGFVFTGQGAQHFSMGRELILKSTPFTQSLYQSEKILKDLGANWSLLEELMRDENTTRLNESALSQPVTTAVQIALVDLLFAIQIQPHMVIGHSSGEIAAAYAAGSISRSTALTVAYYRGIIPQFCKNAALSKGGMLVVSRSEEEILPVLEQLKDGKASVACLNSPSSTTISGDYKAICELETVFEELNVTNKKVKVDIAYHSHHMAAVADEYRRSLANVTYTSPKSSVTFISSVTASPKNHGFCADYWVENLVSKVQFYKALEYYCVSHLGNTSQSSANTQPMHNVFIEIGPHSALARPISHTIAEKAPLLNFSYSPTLVRGRDAEQSILELVGKLSDQGVKFNKSIVSTFMEQHHMAKTLSNLPPYPWDHTNVYWHETRLSKEYRFRPHAEHDLLGVRIPGTSMPIWRHIISTEKLPWLADHIIDGLVVFPGSGYLCMAIEAVKQLHPEAAKSTITLTDIAFEKALIIPKTTEKIEMQLTMQSKRATEFQMYEFHILALTEHETWREHCSGKIKVRVQTGNPRNAKEPNYCDSIETNSEHLDSMLCHGTGRKMDAEAVYQQLSRDGNQYGPTFATIKEAMVDKDRAITLLTIPNIRSVMPNKFMQPHTIHPSTLDVILHGALLIKENTTSPGPVMPVFIGEISIEPNIVDKASQSLLVDLHVSKLGLGLSTANMSVFLGIKKDGVNSHKSKPLMTISGAELRKIEGNFQQSGLIENNNLDMAYTMKWIPDINFSNKPFTNFLQSFAKQLFLKYAHLSIIEINSGSGQWTKSILESFKGDENFVGSYHAADSSPSSDETRAKLSEWASVLHYKTLDISQSPAKQGFNPGTFDLVVMNPASNLSDIDSGSLTNLRSLLRVGGRLMILTNNNTPEDLNHLNSQLVQYSFSEAGVFMDTPAWFVDPVSIIVSKAITTPVETVDKLSFEIIAPPNEQQLSQAIQYYLTSNGHYVSITSWENLCQENVPKKVYIILDDTGNPVLMNSSNEILRKFIDLVQNEMDILWISYHGQNSGGSYTAASNGLVNGVVRTARAEYPSLKFVTLHVRDNIQAAMPVLIESIGKIIETSIINPGCGDSLCEEEFVYHNNEILIPRLLRSATLNPSATQTDTKEIAYSNPGKVTKLRKPQYPSKTKASYFEATPFPSPVLAEDEITIDVKAHSLTPDHLFNLEQSALQLDAKGTYEIAGTVRAMGIKSPPGDYRFKPGDRVCGWVFDSSAYASSYCVKVGNIVPLPDNIPMEIGSALPFTLITAYYSLVVIANLQEGQSLLISGPVTDITRVIAKMAYQLGASVFATFSTEDERKNLVQRAGIPSENVFCENQISTFNPASINFNLVITSSGDTDAETSMQNFVAESGTYILLERSSGHLRRRGEPTSRRVDIMTVSLNPHKVMRSIISRTPDILEKAFLLLGRELSQSLVNANIYPIGDIDSAISVISSPKSNERAILKVDDNSMVQAKRSSYDPDWKFDTDSTYVIVGGFGDVGRQICNLLAYRGAKHILILSRQTPSFEKKLNLQSELQKKSPGLIVHSFSCDISECTAIEQIRTYIDTHSEIPPVRGVIHSAAVLADSTLENMTAEKFRIPLQSKYYGTLNLLSSFNDTSLDFFIMASSVTGVLGSRGQSNYVAGNTFLDAIAQELTESHTHYISLDIGLVDGSSAYDDLTGMVRRQNLVRQGMPPITAADLDTFISYALSPQAREDQCRQALLGFNGRSIAEASEPPTTSWSPMFVHVRGEVNNKEEKEEEDGIVASAETPRSIKEQLQDVAGSKNYVEEAKQLIVLAIKEGLGKLVAMEPSEIDEYMPLLDYGLDSLAAVDLRNWLKREIEASLRVTEILDAENISSLAIKIAEQFYVTAPA